MFGANRVAVLVLILLAAPMGIGQGYCVEDFSGPQVGEKLPEFSFDVFQGPNEGKRLTVAEDRSPIVVLFVHEFNRISFGVMRTVAGYCLKRSGDGLNIQVVFLTNDPTEMEARLARARNALPRNVNLGIYRGGLEGPGAYGLNRKMQITLIVANQKKVTGNFALIQPSVAVDVPKIGAAIAKTLGDKKMPSLKDLGIQARNNRAMAADPPKYRQLMSPVIQKSSNNEQIDVAAAKLESEMQKDPALRKKVFEVTNLIIDSDKLENYGTARTHYHFKKWAKELAPDQNRTPKRIPDSDDAPKKRGQ